MMRSKVVLPDPLTPTTATRSPVEMVTSRPLNNTLSGCATPTRARSTQITAQTLRADEAIAPSARHYFGSVRFNSMGSNSAARAAGELTVDPGSNPLFDLSQLLRGLCFIDATVGNCFVEVI